MILLRIAFRNLWLHKFKTIVVGSILLFGTALVVFGNAILDAIDRSMAVSVVNSVSGHAQIYSAEAKDELALFGDFDGSSKDLGTIADFAKVKRTLEALPEVKTVVPMGVNNALVVTGNILDKKLGELRDAVNQKKVERQRVLKNHVRRIVGDLEKELKNLSDIADMKKVLAESEKNFEALAQAQKPEFWAGFDTNPLDALEFLENKVAPLAFGEDLLWISYIGTDTALYEKTFDRFEIVDGQTIPPGRRGFLFNKKSYEENVKNKTARRLDRLKEKVDEGQRIAECDDCKTWIGHNVKQAASLGYQMDETAAAAARKDLQAYLGTTEADLSALIKSFMEMDDANFKERYDFFYKSIAPHIELYSIRVGDTLVITAYGRGGYVRKVPVKVYGTFRFRSLEKSALAGGYNMMDMMTFRDLYGYMTEEKLKEIADIRKKAGVREVNRETAEEELFGDSGSSAVDQEASAKAFDETAGIDMKESGQRYGREIEEKTYSQDEIESGVVVNAAVLLEDDDHLEEGLAAIEKANTESGLGLKVVSWRKASGLLGQFIFVLSAILYTAMFIIFVVALIIINNSLVMATLERTREIGTMRAIGAQRGVVMRMFLLETSVLALIFGTAGAALGAAGVLLAQHYGIPSWSDFTTFLFAGPRLFPRLLPMHLIAGFVTIAVVGLASTLYPARLATRITPLEAMQKED